MSERSANTGAGARETSGHIRQSDRVYDRLRRDISGQVLKSGEVLHEIPLSERYEASRTPVREALSRLRQEGFLEKAGRQLRVKRFTLPEVRHLYHLREALEKMAVRLCIETAPDESLDEIGRQLDGYASFDIDRDYAAFNEYANDFHRAIGRSCGNPMIREQLEAIHDKVLVINARYWRAAPSVEDAERGHRFILDAIRARDTTVAEAAMRAHIQQVVVLYEQAEGPEGRLAAE